jgi:hypothetical protein
MNKNTGSLSIQKQKTERKFSRDGNHVHHHRNREILKEPSITYRPLLLIATTNRTKGVNFFYAEICGFFFS